MRGFARWMVFFFLIGLVIGSLDRQTLPGDSSDAGAAVTAAPPERAPDALSVAPAITPELPSAGDAFWLGMVLALVIMLMIVYMRWAVFEPGGQGG